MLSLSRGGSGQRNCVGLCGECYLNPIPNSSDPRRCDSGRDGMDMERWTERLGHTIRCVDREPACVVVAARFRLFYRSGLWVR